MHEGTVYEIGKNLPDLLKLTQSMLNDVVTVVENEAEQENSVWFVEMGEV